MVGMALMLIMAGVMMAGMLNIIPLEYYIMVPDYFKLMLFVIGFVFAFLGFMLFLMRAKQTGAIHLLNKGRPGRFLWLYVYDDGEARLTPGLRVGEAQTYNRELDNQVPVTKSYHLADHQLLIIPEGVGCAVDLDYALYADVLESKWGFENLREARDDAFAQAGKVIGLNMSKEKETYANVIKSRQDIKAVANRIIEQRKQIRSPTVNR